MAQALSKRVLPTPFIAEHSRAIEIIGRLSPNRDTPSSRQAEGMPPKHRAAGEISRIPNRILPLYRAVFDIRSQKTLAAKSDPRVVAQWMQRIIDDGGIVSVHFADTSVDPPKGSNLQPMPRIIFGNEGHHDNLFARRGSIAEVALTRGQALVLPPHAWNMPQSKRPLSMVALVQHPDFVRFVKTDWDGNESHLAASSYYHSPGIFGRAFHHLLQSLVALGQTQDPKPTDRLATNAFIHQARKELLNIGVITQSPSEGHLQCIISYLDDNYTSPINLKSVSQRFQLHPNHISRLFQQRGGETFTQHLTRLRVEGAKALLRNYSVTIDEAAQRCGFSDAGYFRKVFTRLAGVSPSQYRAAQTQR